MVVSVATDLANIGVMRLAEVAAPGTPAADFAYMYFKADGLLYTKDDAGVETPATTAGAIILDPASDVRNLIEPAADFIALTVRGSAAAQTKKIFRVQEGSADVEVFSLGAAGKATFQNFVDSTTGFQIFDKDGGTVIFNVDTTNERVGIGTATPSVAFDVLGSAKVLPPTDIVPITIVGHASATAKIIAAQEGSGPTEVFSLSGIGAAIFQNFTDGFQAFRVINKAASHSIFEIRTDGFNDAVSIYQDYQTGGNKTNARGFAVQVDNSSGDVVTNAEGLHIYQGSNSGGGSITNARGLFIEDVDSGGTLNQSIVTNAGNILFNQANGVGNVTIGGAAVSVNYDLMLAGDGVFAQKETTTPTADAGYGKTYWKNDNQFYGQDGAGDEHLIHGTAFSNIWFHGKAAAEVTIAAINAFTQIDSFTVVGDQDNLGNVVGNTGTNDLTLAAGAGGRVDVFFSASVANAGAASKEMIIVPGITLNTPKDITNVTDDTVSPIVVTSVAHGFNNGDMVEIVGVLVNTAANGSFIVDNKANDTFELVAIDDSATTGNGDYDEGTPTGDITIWYPGTLTTHREVSNNTFGVTAHNAPITLSGGDTVGLYVANVDDANNLSVHSVSLSARRVDS